MGGYGLAVLSGVVIAIAVFFLLAVLAVNVYRIHKEKERTV